MRQTLLRGLVGTAMLGALAAQATENGLQNYPVGVNTVLNGLMPLPGETQFYDYTLFYTASKFAGPDGQSSVPGFKANVIVQAPRIMHTWNLHLGPFTLASGAVVPLQYTYTHVPTGSGNRVGLGDVILQPLNIGYSVPERGFFAFFASDFSVPTGGYSASNLANVGINYYTWQPALHVTWLPADKWEVSASAVVQVNSPNRDTNYHSGSIFDLDWVVGYSPAKNLQLGLQGYVLKQFTDDTLNGQVYQDGFRGRVYAVGPQIRYTFAPFSAVVLKWQHEFKAQNRAQGDKVMLEVSMPF